jgi:hypothetical protein
MNESSQLVEEILRLLAEEKPLSALKRLFEGDLTTGTEVQLLLGVLERFTLRESDEIEGLRNSEAANWLRKSILKACQFAAQHPGEFEWTAQLAKVLSIDACGHLGQAFLIDLALGKVDEVSISSSALPGHQQADDSKFGEFFRRYLQQLKPGENRLTLQASKIEQHLLTDERQKLYQSVRTYLQTPSPLLFNGNVVYLMLLKAGIDLAMPTKEDPQDLRLVGIAVEVLADNHDLVSAFELAFQALAISTYSQHKIAVRYAWGILAEAFLRARKYADALVCWNCAASIVDEPILSDIALREVITLIHAMLGLQVWESADALLDIARVRFKLTGRGEIIPHYLLYLEAQVMLAQALGEGVAADKVASRAVALVGPVSEILRSKRYGGVLRGIASVFSAVIRLCEMSGTSVPVQIRGAFDELMSAMGEPDASRYRALSLREISVRQLLELGAMFAVDAQGEALNESWALSVLGPRALTEAVKANSAINALTSLELMTGHHVRAFRYRSEDTILTQFSKGRRDASAFDRWISALELFAQKFSETGEQIEAVGLDSENRLVRVTIHKGKLYGPIVEPRSVFDPSALDQWNRDGFNRLRSLDRFSPYGYDEVQRVVSGLGLSSLSKGTATIVLQSGHAAIVPANLLVREDGFVGESPVAVVPSLSWLKSVRSSQRKATGKVAAWTAKPDANAAISALRIVNEYVHDWFLSVPTELRWRGEPDGPPDLAVVSAHGIVEANGPFFRMLKDEQERPMALGYLEKTLSGVGVVVLLVCSAGKVARSPFLNSSLSLPQRLLDGGCRAVVASPWPLDASKAGRWLELFVSVWREGFNVADAVYFANSELRRQSAHPLDWLAMYVFGDPLVRADDR